MHENMGLRGKKGKKVHPNFATNIAMEFHCHTFCAPPPPEHKSGISKPIVWETCGLHLGFPLVCHVRGFRDVR